MNPVVRLLIWVGLTRRLDNGRLFVPFSGTTWPHFYMTIRRGGKAWPRFYVFRNAPGVIKWRKGRLLPVRWGFGVCGFEFGDRG